MSPIRTLVVTNDFPPRPGGIQTFVSALALRQPLGEVVVYAPAWRGAAVYDATLPYPVVRHRSELMLPEPSVRRRAADIARAEGCERVWFGAAAPLGLLAASLRRSGIERVVASTHGHEAGWALLPAGRQLLRRIGRFADAVTFLGDYTRRPIAGALAGAADRLVQLPPGVDTVAFSPTVDGGAVRRRFGLAGRPVVLCVSRLVARKGQDALIRALPRVIAAVPGTALFVVGGGPARPRLERLAREHGVERDVVFAGSVPQQELPTYYAAGDVFAMPCRTRRGGLDVEGLGMVYLEASATGLPVVAGRSGGAPEAVRDGTTGHVVDGRDAVAVAAAVTKLLADPARAAAMGRSGRAWVEQEWRWEILAARLRALLAGPPQTVTR